MEDLGLGVGLAALAFWGFVAACVFACVWDGIRKRDAQHETIRRLIESGQPIDQALLEKLSLASDGKRKRHDRDFTITGLWLLPIAPGLAFLAQFMGSLEPAAKPPIMGAAALVGCLALGALAAGKYTARWYVMDRDSAE
jgi:hypothetical protein